MNRLELERHLKDVINDIHFMRADLVVRERDAIQLAAFEIEKLKARNPGVDPELIHAIYVQAMRQGLSVGRGTLSYINCYYPERKEPSLKLVVKNDDS